MKNVFFIIILLSLFFTPAFKASAQTLSTTETTQLTFENSGLPQWAKDLRRFDIIAFGLFPFSLFAVTFTTDMIRWHNANGMDFSEAGRRYAPWPLRSAGAVEMSSDDFTRSILIAAGVSVTAALVDLIITMVKRSNEQQRFENQGSGSVIIERIPADEEKQENPPPPSITE